MCGRFVATTPPDQLAAYFGADQLGAAPRLEEALIEPRYNVAPTDKAPVVFERGPESETETGPVRILDGFRWGLIPFWAKDAKIGNKLINARAESVATKPAFRRSLATRRCIVAADSFYEWTLIDGMDEKVAMRVHRVDDSPFAFAGLWDTWRVPDENGRKVIASCTIITTAANELVAKIHDRMPVMLAPRHWDRWLDPTFDDVEDLQSLLVAAPSELLAIHPVGAKVNSTRNDGPELIEPIAVGGAPA